MSNICIIHIICSTLNNKINMRKIFFAIATVLCASCNEAPKTQKIIPEIVIGKQVTETACRPLTITADVGRMRIANKSIECLHYENDGPKLIIKQTITDNPIIINHKRGFLVNGIFIPYSNRMLNSSIRYLRSNRQMSIKNLSKILNTNQLLKIKNEYKKNREQCREFVVVQDGGKLVCTSTLSIDPKNIEQRILEDSSNSLPCWVENLLWMIFGGGITIGTYLLATRKKNKGTSQVKKLITMSQRATEKGKDVNLQYSDSTNDVDITFTKSDANTKKPEQE